MTTIISTGSAQRLISGGPRDFVGQQAVQLHGATGMVDELIVSHYFKRLTVIDLSLGDSDFHLARFGESLRPAPAAPHPSPTPRGSTHHNLARNHPCRPANTHQSVSRRNNEHRQQRRGNHATDHGSGNPAIP
jgi:hypothetical protein